MRFPYRIGSTNHIDVAHAISAHCHLFWADQQRLVAQVHAYRIESAQGFEDELSLPVPQEEIWVHIPMLAVHEVLVIRLTLPQLSGQRVMVPSLVGHHLPAQFQFWFFVCTYYHRSDTLA